MKHVQFVLIKSFYNPLQNHPSIENIAPNAIYIKFLFNLLTPRSIRFRQTGCNRTYYGNVGLTYDLDLHRPKEDKLPYICVLTFTAAGGVNGDIVQVDALAQ